MRMELVLFGIYFTPVFRNTIVTIGLTVLSKVLNRRGLV